jgi:photosystem II stability/assembly factor-like uncharacterized protein
MGNIVFDSTKPTSTNQLQIDSSVDKIAPERHPPCVFAGTTQGLYVFNSTQRLELEGNTITALAVEGNQLWAIANRHAIWHRSSEGEWHLVGSEDNYRLNCLLPIDKAVLVGTSDARLLQISDGTIQNIDSFDQAEERKDWYTPWGGAPDVRSLAVSSSGNLYVNVHVGGILRSRDQGQSWQPTIDLHADVHEVRTMANYPNLVLAATAEGFAWSEDCGESWQFDRTNLHATYARAMAVCDAAEEPTLLMSVSLGPSGSKTALYRRPLYQTGTFQKCHKGLPEWFSDNINTSCLRTWENWAVFGTKAGQIFRSNDAGLTWEEIACDLPPIQCLSLVAPSV